MQFLAHSWSRDLKCQLPRVGASRSRDLKHKLPRKDPEKGRRQQPHQTLKKSKKYKGGKKHHTMVAHKLPRVGALGITSFVTKGRVLLLVPSALDLGFSRLIST